MSNLEVQFGKLARLTDKNCLTLETAWRWYPSAAVVIIRSAVDVECYELSEPRVDESHADCMARTLRRARLAATRAGLWERRQKELA